MTVPVHSEVVKGALLPSEIEIDPRVKSVADFMQQTLQADDLRGVAEAIATLAPAFWGHHRHEKIIAIGLRGQL